MANPTAVALSGRATSSMGRGPTTEFITRGEFHSTIQHRFPQPQPITTEMICESIAFEESLTHTDDNVDYSTHSPTAPEEAVALRLSFRRIPRLVNLEALPKLQTLRVDNNDIPRIENVSHLTSLTSLDLSFNKLSKIEGLEALEHLTDLSLYGNDISVLEGLSSCTRLELLSLGRNRISSLPSIKSLRGFTSLRALSLDANPCSAEDQYRPYTIAFLPQLSFLDYTAITDDERADARSTGVPLEELKAAEEADVAAAAALAADEERLRATSSLRDAHIEAAETGLDDLLSAAAGWTELQMLEEAHEPLTRLSEAMAELGGELKHAGLHRHRQITREIGEFRRAVDAVVATAEGEAAALVVQLRRSIKRATMLARSKDPSALGLLRAVPEQALELKSRLTVSEMETTEKVLGMIDTLDSALGELKALKLGAHETFFRSVETEVRAFSEAMSTAVKDAQARLEAQGSLPDGIPEHGDVAVALQSRDGAETFCKEFADTLDAAVIAMDESARKRVQDLCNRAVGDAKAAERERNRARLTELASLVQTASDHVAQAAASMSLRRAYSREKPSETARAAFGGGFSPMM